MTDPSDLPPAQEVVRRLLAEARHDEPAPPEVVARLDATLAHLHADASAAPSPAPVIDLASRRRRRKASTGLLAAAAVVVAGVALGQMLPGSSDDTGSSADSATTSSRNQLRETPSSIPEDTVGPEADFQANSPSDAGTQSRKTAMPEASGVPVITLDTDLAKTLLVLRSEPLASSLTGAYDRAACEVGQIGQGRRVDVQVEQQAGLVLYRPPSGAEQVVEVFVCGNPSPVRTLTLSAP